MIFKALVDTSPLSIVITDLQGTILYVSRAALEMGRWDKPEDLIGKNGFIFMDPKDSDRVQENLKKIFQDGVTSNIDYVLPRRDGSHYAGELSSTLLRDVQGKPIAFLGILRDKTDVQESKEQFQFLFENTPSGVGISSPSGKILLANNSMAVIFGYPLKDFKNFNINSMSVNLEDQKKLLELVEKNGEVLNFEAELLKKTGDKFWASISLKKLEFSGEKNFLVTLIDITERKKSEAALKNLYNETVKMSEMKTHIITYASHELKTPLIPISGWADFILKAKLNGKDLNKAIETEDLESILRNSKRLQRIIDEFLDVGRIQGGKLKLDYEPVKLKEITKSAIHSLEQQATSRQITIHLEVEDIILQIDGFRIEQVLINLLSNAIKYSPSNTNVWIRSQIHETTIAISVEDQGFGFSPKELEGAFQPFSPSFLEGKGEKMFTGTGVGLYICKGIVERHGGSLQIESPGKDKGSKVTIFLPRVPPDLK